MRESPDLKSVSDAKLLLGLFEILKRTRHDEADLVAHIAEVDARKLYAREAAPSMFVWCTERLHLAEQEAYLRITVARASREHPMLLEMLRDGRLHLSGIARLVPHLTPENRDIVLKRATGLSHRQVRELVSELEPRPDVPARIRELPGRTGQTKTRSVQLGAPRVEATTNGPETAARGGEESSEGPRESGPVLSPSPGRGGAEPGPARRATVEPLAPARFRVQFTASAELRDKLERLQALMRSSVPDGDLAKIIDVAVTRELERIEARRFAKTEKPRKRLAQTDTRPSSRHVPAAVRRFVERRDGGQCTYRDKGGKRCSERHSLEFHHRRPFAQGGHHDPENLALVCRTHNALAAEQDFGREVMMRHRRRASHDRGTGLAGVAAAGPVDAGAGRRGPRDSKVVGAGPDQSGLRARSS